jgi:hypothetical protein
METTLQELERVSSRGEWIWACLALTACLGIAGCGEGSFGGSRDYPVKGIVVQSDGKPLSAGRVVFVSDETALSYGGTIGADGNFELKQGSRVGAPAGNYKVRVEIDETTIPKTRKRASNLPFAGKYLDEDASKLVATVKTEGENAFEFKLTR